MTPKRWKKIEAIIDQALDFESNQKQQLFIKRSCKNDRQLYEQVFSIIESIRKAREDNFLERL